MGTKKGFTLVELLVVISIIAILLAVLMPSLKKAREHAQRVVCMTHMRSLIQGVHVYSESYNGQLPSSVEGMNASLSNFVWQNFVSPRGYVNLGRLYGTKVITDTAIYYCPLQKVPEVGRKDIAWNYVRSANEEKATSYIYGLLAQVDLDRTLERHSMKMANLRNRVLACDTFVPFTEQKTGTKYMTWTDKKGFNAVFGDGHTVFFSASAHPKLIKGAESLSTIGKGAPLYRADLFVASMFELVAGNETPMKKWFPTYYP